ncbi:unnamed protein product, partial [Brenthis ino]
MVEKGEIKPETLLNLDDLLQCPVCYEIPSGQIFQCNEGHHVCGRCKMRLDVCPVCRALFFGTRNYAMEELIANFRKLRAFKLGTKSQTGSGSSESTTPAREIASGECENDNNEDDEENNPNIVNQPTQGPPQACKGLFRCLCCKNGNGERLPAARLLNHLRYFHAPDLLEGRSENGEYLQAWQFSTTPGKIVTAVRIADMGIFFLTIELNNDAVCAWLTMAASPWVAHAFHYTVTICGNDREAIFSDCVWSVRSCEGSLKKRGHCLVVKEMDARALMAPAIISGKLSVRRTPPDQLTTQTQPRAILRIANRGNNNMPRVLEPSFLEDLQNDVERLSRAFESLGRETNALVVRTEALGHARNEQETEQAHNEEPVEEPQPAEEMLNYLSRNARRRMRARVRAALSELVPPTAPPVPAPAPAPAPASAPTPAQAPVHGQNRGWNFGEHRHSFPALRPPPSLAEEPVRPTVSPPVPPSSSSNGPPQAQPQAGNRPRNKKKRRHRR